VVAEAVDGQDAILKSIDLRPDIAMINSELPVIGSIEVTRQIRRRRSIARCNMPSTASVKLFGGSQAG